MESEEVEAGGKVTSPVESRGQTVERGGECASTATEAGLIRCTRWATGGSALGAGWRSSGDGNERPARDGRTRGHITGKTSSATPSASLARDERDGFNVSEHKRRWR